MQAQVSNGYIRELAAERDYLKARNIQLSESLDENGSKYRAILASLGYDEEGRPLPKEPSTGGPDGADGADITESYGSRKA